VETDRQTDGGDCITSRANAVGNQIKKQLQKQIFQRSAFYDAKRHSLDYFLHIFPPFE